jgi:hypothetical protein
MSPSGGARFDKDGNALPDTGHGCGCQICADAHAAHVRAARPWAIAQRRAMQLVRKLISTDRRRQTA